MNRLKDATSPYLLQHADNPVDWWEWSEEAFADARERDLPVLLSVGYAACHWCHVMAHESFEDSLTASVMNEHFVSIKVDREERPDVDAVYMQATQAMTGQGGWPMTVVMTPEGVPFFAGTYFPDKPRHGQPAFRQILAGLSDAWVNRRDEVASVAEDLKGHLQSSMSLGSGQPIDAAVCAAAVNTLAQEYDAERHGFGKAPKFPPSMVLEFLLRHAARTGSTAAQQMADGTLEAMARGGIYDQLAGGFARYSVDREWVVPHFEKMLYDNAQLLGVYARWWRQTGTPLGARVARETADFLLAELRTPEGGFASALDADTDGVEGKFYAWTPDQLEQALGRDEGQWAASLLAVELAGTFEHGSSTLQLLEDPLDPARWASTRDRLRAKRDERTRPARDDKIVAAWNGMAISSLAQAGALLDEPTYVDAAVAAAQLLVDVHLRDDRLLRVSRDGRAGTHAGVLEDYALVADGFLGLVQATGDGVWLERAGALLDTAMAHFGSDDGGFFDTADDAEALIARPRDPSDNASPSGHSAMCHALLTYAALTGSGQHRDRAEEALRAVRRLGEKVPRFAGWSLAAAEAAMAGPLEIAVVGESAELLAAARRTTSPGAVVIANADGVPLMEGRTIVDGQPAAYVCRGMVCQRPVTSVEGLQKAMMRGE
ncbi:MAG TPA: thioredoxin domain-containing protein [Nocardioidaceae bacterium]|nr:thioredoxin domain-containing protein [Nocardioidaceae bacterium]